ncbi:MAG: cation:proton antiporter [Candidatus Nanohaloarchaea archaeon]
MAELITSLSLIFVFSAITLLVSEKLSQPAIPAYIVAGIAAGAFIEQSRLVDLAQVGIAFLVFIFGLKFDPEKLNSVETEALTVNTLQVVLIGTLSYSFAEIIGLSFPQSAYFSIAATLSSSLVGLELLSEEVDKRLIHGRLAESINLIQDLFAIGAVILVSSPLFMPASILLNLIYASGLFLSALVFRKSIFSSLASLADGSDEMLMLLGLSVLTGFIAISGYLGISIVIGSFAAGMAVARFPHNLEMLETMGSLKDFFSAIFFVTLGALLSVPGPLALMLTFSLVMFNSLIKPGLMINSLIHQGYDPRTSFITGVSLDQVSEFSLVIAIQAWITGIIVEPLFQAVVLSATLTMTTSAYTRKYENRLFEFLERFNIVESSRDVMPESNFEELEDHILLVGYDTQGKRIAETLRKMEVEFAVIENDPEKISELTNRNLKYAYGNVMNSETWELCDTEKAKLVISTAPFRMVSERILELEADTEVILRSEKLDEARKLMEKGAIYVIVPEILTAELIREHLLGLESEQNYAEELRRRSLLEVRSYLESEDR